MVAATVSLVFGGVRASALTHFRLLANVLRWPMAAFDSTPSGRVTNRFSKETDVIDTQLPMNFQFWLMCLMRTVSIFVVLGLALKIAILALLPVAVLYFVVQVRTHAHSKFNVMPSNSAVTDGLKIMSSILRVNTNKTCHLLAAELKPKNNTKYTTLYVL